MGTKRVVPGESPNKANDAKTPGETGANYVDPAR